jgi:hypothetical protein
MRFSDGSTGHRPDHEPYRPKDEDPMTYLADPGAGYNTPAPGKLPLEELDLSPQGLADAPASQQDQDSIVYIGIPD